MKSLFMVVDVLMFISVLRVRSKLRFCMLKSSTETDVRRILVYSYYHKTSQVLFLDFIRILFAAMYILWYTTKEEMKHSNVYRDCG